MTIIERSALLLPILLLAACAEAPQRASVAPAASAVPAAAAEAPATEARPEDAGQEARDEQPNLPHLELDGKTFYDFLLGDLAAQRGNPELAAKLYMELAETTQDPRVARRAAQLAFDAHRPDQAVPALKLWLKLDPASKQAREGLVTALLTGGRLDEAEPYIRELLAARPDAAGRMLVQLYPLLARYPDRNAVYALLRDLAAPYPKSAEAHWVLAQAADAAGQNGVALDEVRQARTLRPDWELGVLAEAQLLARTDPKQSLDVLKKYLDTHPEASESRLFYTRGLVDQKQYPEARAEFQKLLAEHPDNADLAFASAMLSIQMGELDRAEGELRKALENGKQDPGTVYYYLGQLDEEMKRNDEALDNYRKVTDGEYAYSARLRIAYLLYKGGKLKEARECLQQTPARNNQQRVELLSAEANMLRDSGHVETAYQVMKRGLEKLPNHPELLYETGMLANQLGKYAEFEQMMRKVIELSPDQAQAYNAMGYSLLERNERVQEGMKLVQKAFELAPGDAAIMDSVGWGYYRLGDLSRSLDFLHRAYTALPDPEIAAHLGEVLWVHGDKDEAKKIWGDALASHPGNEILQAVVKKFQP